MNKFYLMLTLSVALIFLEQNMIILFIMHWFLLSFFLTDNHLSVVLVHLEVLTMFVMVIYAMEFIKSSWGVMLMFVIMTVGVIEASVGLAIFSLLTRSVAEELMKFKF